MTVLPKYERYKKSGIEWVGEVPEHWDVLPGRATLSLNKEKNTGNVGGNVGENNGAYEGKCLHHYSRIG
jgi:hypothetical protein